MKLSPMTLRPSSTCNITSSGLWTELNFRSLVYENSALTTELQMPYHSHVMNVPMLNATQSVCIIVIQMSHDSLYNGIIWYTCLSIVLATFGYRVRGTCVPTPAFHALLTR